MTAKRFQVYKVSGNFGEWEVEDTLTDTVVMDRIMHKYLADRLCEKLNELFDENEQLKKILNDTVSQLDAEISDDYSVYSVRIVVDSVMFRRIKEICR